jgi:hypothetical protein
LLGLKSKDGGSVSSEENGSLCVRVALAPNKERWLQQRLLVRHSIFPSVERDVSFSKQTSLQTAARCSIAKMAPGVIGRLFDQELIASEHCDGWLVAETNADPTPFTWTANPDKIIAAVKRGHQVLDSIH